MTESSDILVEITDDYLPKLASLYRQKAIWAPYMTGLVDNGIRWRKRDKFKNAIKFYSPNKSWEEDGTILAIIQFSFCQDILIYTLDETSANLFKALTETKLIKYDRRTVFYAVHDKHISILKKYLKEHQLEIDFENNCFIYGVPPEEAKKFIVECPLDVYIKRLEPPLAKQVNDAWPHQFENSEEYLANYIEVNGGYGVFLKRTNEMVAWVLKHAFGHPAMLQTADGHQRKGYASLVLKALSKEVGEEGHWPVGTVLVNNKVSISMFEKLGFRSIGTCSFIAVKKIK